MGWCRVCWKGFVGWRLRVWGDGDGRYEGRGEGYRGGRGDGGLVW